MSVMPIGYLVHKPIIQLEWQQLLGCVSARRTSRVRHWNPCRAYSTLLRLHSPNGGCCVRGSCRGPTRLA